MEFTAQNFVDTILFIEGFREMERATLKHNKLVIKSIVKSHQADHLYDSWHGRKNNFGSFFLNLSHENQGYFAEHFGLEIEGFQEFRNILDEHPAKYISTVPPLIISFLHQIILFFYNNGIDKHSIPGITLYNLPKKRFGNSTNWGNYILSLRLDEQMDVLEQIASNSIPNIVRDNDMKESFKEVPVPQKNSVLNDNAKGY